MQSAEAGVNGWAPAAMAKGLSEVGLWIRRAGHALLLEAGAYREIAQDAYMNAPAVLIALVFSASSSLGRMRQFDPLNMLGAFFGWFVAVAVIFGGARALKGKGDFSSTVRVVGFAHVGNLLYLLAFFPAMAQISSLAATVVTFIGIWLGAAQAHDLKGWRSLLLPFVAILVTVISLFIIYILARGLGMTLDTFMQSIGISMPS